MDESEKLPVTAEAMAHASLMMNLSLFQVLHDKGILSSEDVNFISALAASMCRGGQNELAAQLIETIQPTSKGVSIPVEAMKRRIWISKDGQK